MVNGDAVERQTPFLWETKQRSTNSHLSLLEEEEEVAEEAEEPAAPKTPTPKARKMSRKESARKAAAARKAKAAAADAEEEPEEESNEAPPEEPKAEEETPMRRSTRRSSLPTPKTPAAATPASAKRGKRKREETVEETEAPVEEKPEPKTPASSRRSGRLRRPTEVSDSASNASARSTPQPASRPKRAAKAPATEPRRSGRPSASATETPTQAKKSSAPPATAPPAKRPKKAGRKSKHEPDDDEDPFDFDQQADESPAPLKHISAVRAQHGAVSFTATPATKTGGSKFSFTETAAAMRAAGTAGTPSLATAGTTLPKSGAKSGRKGRTPKHAAGSTPKAALFGDIEDRLGEEEEEEAAEPAPAPSTPATPARRGRKSGSAAATPKTPASSSRKAAVPVLSVEEQLTADNPEDIIVPHLVPGGRVLAKWPGDKCFYAAWVVESSGFGAFRVKYWDGAVRQCPGPDLVPLGHITPPKMLMRMGEEDELLPVRIESTPSHSDAADWAAGLFTVFNETTEETEKVHWEKFVIEKEQTKDFVSTDVNKLAQEVTADNISSTRKRERHKVREEPTPEPAPAPKATPRSKAKGTPGRPPAAKADPKRFFAGLHFVLTSANRRPKGEDGEESAQPAFNKKSVRGTIEERGGTVVEDFSATNEPASRLFLVADTHYRTHKYLSALARAVPCVNHTWILDSVAQEKLLDYGSYMLPAGVSLERGDVVEWHDECPQLLAGCSVLVHTENRPSNPSALDFVQIWSPLVACMGADIVDSLDAASKLDVLLTDASCAKETLDAAAAKGATPVSSEWLIQAIITGERPDAEAHPKYDYSFVETLPAPK